MISRYFRFEENNTNYRNEIMGGLTTFMAMAYIIFVNPAILSAAGMDFDSVTIATCLSAALATLIMGILARYPIAQAPGLGANAFFAFSVVIGMGISWQAALGAVFISGVIFLLLTILKVREAIISIVPQDLQRAIAVGIGLFIAAMGFWHAGLIERDPAALLTLGPIHDPASLLAIAGFFILVILVVLKIRGAILLGMLITMIIGLLTGVIHYQGIVSAPPSIDPVFLKLDILGALSADMITVILVFLFIDMFDTMGTLIGIGNQAGFMKDGKLPRASKALFSDAVGTTAGALLGTSTTTSYIESGAGIEQGGKTGLTSIVTGLMFLTGLLFIPVIGIVPSFATGPALVMVGLFMMKEVVRIDFSRLDEAFPSFIIIVMIALSYSISNGLAFGFISFTLLKMVSFKFDEIKPAMWIITVLSILFYVI